MPVEKQDLKKSLKHLYHSSAKAVAQVDVPKMNYLMVDGEGDPNNSKSFTSAIETLFGLSYTLKFALKKSGGPDYSVLPLEGLWWNDGQRFSLENKNKGLWRWTLMIMQPEWVTAKLVESAREQLERKRGTSTSHARFEPLEEGRSAQILHIGPYAEEAPTIAKLHAFIAGQGGHLTGKHHEIYLGDPRRTAPEKLKTILRQPFAI